MLRIELRVAESGNAKAATSALLYRYNLSYNEIRFNPDTFLSNVPFRKSMANLGMLTNVSSSTWTAKMESHLVRALLVGMGDFRPNGHRFVSG